MRTSRRRFLAAASAAPALLPQARTAREPRVTALRDSSFDPWIEISAANLRHNVGEIHRRVEGRPIFAVIKNNGYGAGVVNVARAIEPLAAIAGFAVVKLHEAITLRDAGIVKPVLLMGPFAETELEAIVRRRIMPMVYTPIAAALDRAAARVGRAVPIHAYMDTGLGRDGVPFREARALIAALAERPSITIDGTMTTFSEDPALDSEQLMRFDSLTRELAASGARIGRRHAASSFAVFQRPDAFLDMVRPGMAIYGIYSEAPFRTLGVLDLKPAIALKTRVIYVKQLQPGDSAGYERAYVAARPVWIATLAVGHADGVPRSAANRARVRIDGTLYPIVASVSASHCLIEIGEAPAVKVGDVATIFDAENGSCPDDFAAAAGASVYDLIMHLHADLPRRLT